MKKDKLKTTRRRFLKSSAAGVARGSAFPFQGCEAEAGVLSNCSRVTLRPFLVMSL